MAAKHLGTTEIEAPEGGASSSDEYIVHHRIQGKKVDTSYISEFERLYNTDSSHYERRRRKRRSRSKVAIFVLLALLILGGVCGLAGVQLYRDAKEVRADAHVVLEDLDEFKDAVVTADKLRVSQITENIAVTSSSMHAKTQGALWNAAALIPVVGEDIRQVKTLCSVLDNLSTQAIEPLGEALADVGISELIGDDNTIDVVRLERVVNALGGAKGAVDSANQALSGLGTSHIDQVEEAVTKARSKLSGLGELVDKADAVAPYLPKLLGSERTRTYLIVAMNNSEARAMGGFPGSWGTITASGGRLSLGDFVTIAGARPGVDERIPVSDEEYALWAETLELSPANSTFVPHYPRAAELLSQQWDAFGYESDIEGVIALDPVFLQNVLALVNGSVTVDEIGVDGSNAAERLLSWPYWNIEENEAQNAFFARVAHAAFDEFLGKLGTVDILKLGEFIRQTGVDRRFLVWMEDEGEQGAIDAIGLAGELPDDPTVPIATVCINDNTWAKMDWYLDVRSALGESVRNDDGTTSYQVTTTLANRMTQEELWEAPKYVTGSSPAKRDPGDIVTDLLLVAPAEGSISNVSCSSGQTLSEYALYEHDVWKGQVNCTVGETITITYTVTVPASAQEVLYVRQSPLGRTFTD